MKRNQTKRQAIFALGDAVDVLRGAARCPDLRLKFRHRQDALDLADSIEQAMRTLGVLRERRTGVDYLDANPLEHDRRAVSAGDGVRKQAVGELVSPVGGDSGI